ncbi:MAG: hypothetical protein JNL66_13630 [Alphaproteobacteria bacterium]|nr:hypothetical protein [Alphaproteobacteria bacterium]
MSVVAVAAEKVAREGGEQIVAAQISGVGEPYRLWYRVPAAAALDDVAIGHALAVSVITQAMAVGRDVALDLPLTRGLVQNLDEFQRVWATWHPDRFRRVALRPSALVDDEPFRSERGAAVGFSLGVDSCFSAHTLARAGDLGGLVAVRGLEVGLADDGRWDGMVKGVAACARALDRPFIAASTNWEECAVRRPGYLGYHLPIVAALALVSRGFGWGAVPSSYSYAHLTVPLETNPLTDPMLGRPGFPLRQHGAWARRIEKVAAIAAWPEAVRHLRPCDAIRPDGTACGRCRKCVHSALMFAALGHAVPDALGGRIPSPEQIAGIDVTPYARLSLTEVLAAARGRGCAEPWVAAVEARLARAGGATRSADEADRAERQLRYVLGVGPRSAASRYLRRLGRALRGRTRPRSWPD